MPARELSMEKQRDIIEHFKAAVAEVWLKDGQSTWPIEINSIVHLFMDIFASEILEDIGRLKANGVDDVDIAARLKTSARIIRLLMPCVLGMKAGRLAPDRVREKVLYLLSLARHLKYGDLLNRDGKNIVLSPAGFKNKVDEKKLLPADPISSRAVHKLCAVLWNYAESLNFRVHGFSREFHGPYGLPGKREDILVRDFICLKPVELWPECQAVEYENIMIVTAYQGLEMNIDIYNNVSIKEGTTYVNNLRAYHIEADGKMLLPEEIDPLCTLLAEVMIAVTARVEALHWRQLAKKYAEIFWYSKKELRDAADWYPPGVVDERIERGELSTRLQNLDPQALLRMLRIAF